MGILLLAPTQYGFELFKKTHLSLVDPLVGLTFVLWLPGVWKSGFRRLFRGDLAFPILLIGLAALSLIPTTNRLRTVAEIVQWAEYVIVAYLLFRSGLEMPAVRPWMVRLFAAASALVIGLGVAHYTMAGLDDFKVRSTFGNANVLGGFLALSLPVLFGLMLDASCWKWRIGLLLAILAGFAVVLSGGAFLALIAALAVMAAARGWKAFAAYALALLAVVFLLMPLLPRDNLEGLWQSVRLFDDDGVVTRRYAEWQAAMEMIREHPLAGVGAGCYQDRIGAFYGMIPVVGGVPSPPDSQNLFLVLGASIGLPGLAAFGGLILLALAQAARRAVRAAPAAKNGLALGVFGSLLAFLVASLWSPLLVRGIGVPLAFVLALAAARPAGPSQNSASPASAPAAM